jgi:uncharacterized protein (TIGR00251 family)
LKVVPGASRDSVDGWLGEALKVRVRAPAERGKANAAVGRIVARALGVPIEDVSIVSGHASPRKTIEIQGLSADEIRERIGAPAR